MFVDCKLRRLVLSLGKCSEIIGSQRRKQHERARDPRSIGYQPLAGLGEMVMKETE